MQNFRVDFYRLIKEENKKTREVNITGSEFMGSVTLDDSFVDDRTSLVALAYRRATPQQQLCDRVVVERL